MNKQSYEILKLIEKRDPRKSVARKIVEDSSKGLRIPVGVVEYLKSVPRRNHE